MFSPSEISFVRIKINDEDWLDCDVQGNGPLYVAKWNPSQYATGMHTIKVCIV